MSSLTVLFGSETGNAEDLAKRIGWQARRRSLGVTVSACDHYDIRNLVNEELVLFVVSTTGDGDEPNNMRTFWKFIRRQDLPNDSLSGVRTAVIGLGDSSYEKYNFVAKKLYKRLKQLGAQMVLKLALGDEQHDFGANAFIRPSIHKFWTEVMLLSDNTVDDELISATFSASFVAHNYSPIKNCEFSDKKLSEKYNKYNPYFAKVLSNERVTSSDHFQDVRLIKLQLSDEPSLNYFPGDVCVVRPENSAENVHKFISLLNLNANDLFILTKRDNNWMSDSYYNYLPVPCSVFELVSKYLDIQSVPKPSFFELLWHFSRSDLEKQKLKDFSNSDEDLCDYCYRPKRNILEVLEDFPQTTPYIKFEYLFDLIPAITARPFSIASSLNSKPNQIHLLVAVVKYKTRMKKPRLGLCSNWLARQTPENDCRVGIFIRKSKFKLPSDSSSVLMIGPGTGVAPFRSFIQERLFRTVSDNYLFFGCRYREADFYLEDEWLETRNKGYLNYFVAFSRQFPDKKVYVQHLLWEERQLVWRLISSEAYIYVAGNAKQMPLQVRETLLKIIQENGNQILNCSAEEFLNRYEAKGKLQFECWS